jgi:hypothetical protein
MGNGGYFARAKAASAQWARFTRKLAKIITLLVLIETHIFNKIRMKIRKISIKFNETNGIEDFSPLSQNATICQLDIQQQWCR